MAARIELTAPPEASGSRLDVLVAAAPEVGSRAAAQRLIEAGHVLVDGRPRPKRHRLVEGEHVVVHLDHDDGRALAPETPMPVVLGAADRRSDADPDPDAYVDADPDLDAGLPPVRIVFEDEHLMVVDKPAGLTVHPAAGHRGATLAGALQGRAAGGPDPARAGIVHRLDRDTSGLLVVAKGEEAFGELSRLIRDRAVRREYRALVEGQPATRSGTIDAPIGRDRRRRVSVSTSTDRPRDARTHFWLLEALARTALLGVRLETGRTHQIRAHLLAIGHPVCGDPGYGGAGSGPRLGLRRQFLHATRLAFLHPVTGAELDLRSPLPADLRGALVRAREER